MKTLGTYTYNHLMYKHSSRAYQVFTIRVEVVNERANKWQVKYLGFHASGEAPGGLHWVRKDKVRLDEVIGVGALVDSAIKNPPPIPPTPPINTQQDAIDALESIYIRETRLPYKDD